MRRVVVYFLALLVTAIAVAGGVRLAAETTTVLDQFKGGTAATVRPRPTTPSGPVPAQGQSFVTGTVDKLVAEGAQGAPVAAPFTITALERGAGRATIENALVNGRRTSIAWAGGTPLPITGDGAIDLSGSRLDVDTGGATWRVDGAPRSLQPGRYRAGASVAVGVGGLATPRDTVEFTADAMTQVQATGGVVVKLPPKRLEVTGPGKVSATGQLLVQDPRTRLPAQSVQFGEGPYKVALTPSGGRFEVDAVLQGPITRA